MQHGAGHRQDVGAFIVEEVTRWRHAGQRIDEQPLFGLRGGDMPVGRVRHASGVMQHRGGHAVQFLVIGQLSGEDVLPFAEADLHMHLH